MSKEQEDAAFGMFLLEAVAKDVGVDFQGTASEIARKIDRAIYKGTDCGAYVRFDEKGVVVGSIVEGSDAEFSRRIDLSGIDISDEGSELLVQRFWSAVAEIEDLACEAWHEANGE